MSIESTASGALSTPQSDQVDSIISFTVEPPPYIAIYDDLQTRDGYPWQTILAAADPYLYQIQEEIGVHARMIAQAYVLTFGTMPRQDDEISQTLASLTSIRRRIDPNIPLVWNKRQNGFEYYNDGWHLLRTSDRLIHLMTLAAIAAHREVGEGPTPVAGTYSFIDMGKNHIVEAEERVAGLFA